MPKYLKSYKEKQLGGYFTDGRTIYELTIEEVNIFGKSKQKTIDFTVDFDQNDLEYHKNWDRLIETRKPLKENKLTILDYLFLTLVIGIYLIVVNIVPIVIGAIIIALYLTS